MDIKRVFVIVLDGVGAGEAPDAAEYGDEGSNSLGNTARAMGGLRLPNMGELGIGNLTDIQGVQPRTQTQGAYGRMQEASAGKDSINGHWELMGVVLQEPLPTYPNGFPPEVIDEFKRLTGRGVLGNKPASGTEILVELGEEHMRTGDLIVYTSADSVFQIAAHEDIVPIPELYRYCQIARDMLKGKHAVGRVIARPFTGSNAAGFKRTERRHDYPLAPVGETMMDRLIKAGKQVYATGKIDDLFGNRGISKTFHTVDNEASIQAGIDFLKEDIEGLIFSNLIEFDMTYGHRNDVKGYAAKLEEFDRRIPQIRAAMGQTDIAVVVADHGVDPTTPSTDHSREYIPLLVFGVPVKNDVNLGDRKTYSDLAASIAEIFDLEPPEIGTSFLGEILR